MVVTPPGIVNMPPAGTVLNHNASLAVMEKRMSTILLQSLQASEELSWASKHELLQLLGDSLYLDSKWPTKEAKEHLAKALVERYQHLRDRLGNGFSSWVLKLDNVLKNMRQRDPSTDVRHRKKRRLDVEFVINQRLETQDGTDMSENFEADKEVMKREMMKAEHTRNYELINSLMEATESQRNKMIAENAKVSSLKEHYPALFDIKIIQSEFKKKMKIDADKVLTETWGPMARKLIADQRKTNKKPAVGVVLAELDRFVNFKKCAI